MNFIDANIIIGLGIIVGVVFFAILAYKEPFLKGKIGEGFVFRKLLELDPDKYKVLNDILIPSQGNTENTQIDHIVVSNYGVFCIETKSYKGWIFGNAKQRYWTQVIYKSKKRFYNPLWQNYAHLKSIEQLVRPDFPGIPIISLVVFPSAEKLQISGTDLVANTRDTVERIKSFNTEVLSNIERDKIVQILREANIVDDKARKADNDKIREAKVANI